MNKAQTQTLKLLLAVTNNPKFQLDCYFFRQRWGIPIGGFNNFTDYEKWVKSKDRSYLLLYSDLERIMAKAHLLKRDEVGCMLLVTYLVRNQLAVFSEKIKISSRFKLSGFLGYIEKTAFLPFLTGSSQKDKSGNLQKYLAIIGALENKISISLDQQQIDDSYLAAVPGNSADSVFTTQRNIEDLIERGIASLRHTVANINDFSIKKYEDKNRHIDGGVRQTGSFAMGRRIYAIAEIYWLAIAKEVEKISEEIGVELNKGIPLANAGVSQLAQEKVLDGLRNLFFALKDDEKVLIALQDPNTDPATNLVNINLYTQFEERLNSRIVEIIKTSGINLDSSIKLEETLKSLLSNLNPDKRLFFFYLLAEFFSTIEKNKTISDDLLSRSILLRVLGGYAAWLEDLLKKKYSTTDGLYQLFETHLSINSMVLDGGYAAYNLDDLEIKVSKVISDSTSEELKNAKVTNLIRNFAIHNFQTENHAFYAKSVEYFSRMLYLTLQLHTNGKL